MDKNEHSRNQVELSDEQLDEVSGGRKLQPPKTMDMGQGATQYDFGKDTLIFNAEL